jgi:hypothetical protein
MIWLILAFFVGAVVGAGLILWAANRALSSQP